MLGKFGVHEHAFILKKDTWESSCNIRIRCFVNWDDLHPA